MRLQAGFSGRLKLPMTSQALPSAWKLFANVKKSSRIGTVFTDYSPVTEQKAMANVSWLSLLFLNYHEPLRRFTRILRSKGENVVFNVLTLFGSKYV